MEVTINTPAARAHGIRETTQTRRLRLLVLAHANRTAGGRSVGQNFLEAVARLNDRVETIAVLPAECGYERIVDLTALQAIWFRQNGSAAKRLFFDAITLPRQVRRMQPDAIMALGNLGLLNPSVPQAILIHDAHYVYPRCHYGRMGIGESLRYAFQGRQLAYCIPQCTLVYCQTCTMLHRVQQTYGRTHRIRLLPNCLPSVLRTNDANPSAPERLSAYGGRFRLICLTRHYAHKNLEIIVEMFRKYKHRLEEVVVFLTISPDQSRDARRLLRTIDRWGLENHIINLGQINQPEIPAYFRNCHALLFPTLLESFSATYLEAMHCSLPILTSDLDFAREVCGQAALYFDPWSSDSIGQAILHLRSDSRLQRELAEAGRRQLARVHDHTWDDIAKTVVSDLWDIVKTSDAR